MAVQAMLQVKDGDTLGAVRVLLKTLLDRNLVDALLVPLEVPSADQVTPILTRQAAQLDTANPLAPVMRVNAAAVIARLQRDETASTLGSAGRIGAVLRPCELRAAIELAKVGRIDLSRLLLIGIDCMGTYEASDYAQIARASQDSPTDEMMRWTRQGPIAPYRLRNACQMCEHFTAEVANPATRKGNADVAIGLIGMNVRERLLVQASDEVASKIHLGATEANGREKAVARLAAIRHQRREEALAQASQLLSDLPALMGLAAPCTACGECQDACPFCNTNAFLPKPAKEPHTDRVRTWPKTEGPQHATREQSVGFFGELISVSRRAASCVSCGMCESSCARHVPLTAIQGVLGSKIQQEFKYVPGRRADERLPWATA